MLLFIICISVPKMGNCSFHIFSLPAKNRIPKALKIKHRKTEQKFCSVLLFIISFHHTMYRPTKPVDWCQCCKRGSALLAESASQNE